MTFQCVLSQKLVVSLSINSNTRLYVVATFTGFHFGARQCGTTVNDVTLPPWCNSDPYLFVKIHRQALESDYVTAHLHQWLDLVFGHKQKGQAAVESFNCYNPLTYFGLDINQAADSLDREALLTAINCYGQTPKQLFTSPHPRSARAPTAYYRTSTSSITPGLDTVRGLKWGTYCGSPACDEPRTRWIQRHGGHVSSLVALPTGEVFGLGPRSHLMVNYSKQQRAAADMTRRDVIWAAILSWGHADSVLRVRNKKDKPAVNFLRWSTDEQVPVQVFLCRYTDVIMPCG